jgi:hypothetical protein
MPLVSRTLKLRLLLYQTRVEPATAASDPRVASNVTRRARRVKADSFCRTDGNGELITHSRESQESVWATV